MALVENQASPAVLQAYESGLRNLAGNDNPRSLQFHVPVYTLGIEEIAEGAGLEVARYAGCRFYSGCATGDSPLYCEMTPEDAYRNSPLVRSLSRGDYAKNVIGAIGIAMTAVTFLEADYGFRMFCSPGLFVEYLWFHSLQHGREDWFLPTLSLTKSIEQFELWTTKEVFGTLRPLAIERLQYEGADFS